MQWIIKRCALGMLSALVIFYSIMSPLAYAAAPGSILAKGTYDDSVIIFIQDPESEPVEVQIGTRVCSDVTVADGKDETIHTLFLLDNSLSIAEKYRPIINEVLTNIVASRSGNESFSLATYTDKLNYLIQDSNDYGALKKAIDSIEYNSHESHLTPVLYELFGSLAQSEAMKFHKVVIISDGASEETIGYSYTELSERIKTSPYPIYSIGVAFDNNGNKQELENLFALSRLTKGDTWRINDITDTLNVAATIADGNRIKKIVVIPPVEMCDGTEKGIRVFGGTFSDQTTIVMPFGHQAAVPTNSQNETIAPSDTMPQIPESTPTISEPEDEVFPAALVAIIAAVLIICAVVGILVAKKKGGQAEKKEKSSDNNTGSEKVGQEYQEDDVTAYASSSLDSDTAMVFSGRKKMPTLVLTDVNDSNRRYKAALTDDIAVGRRSDQGCKIVIPDQSVSKKHCVFSYSRGVLYISDSGSKNGTLVDGEEINDITRVEDGSRVTLGDVELRVEIRDA